MMVQVYCNDKKKTWLMITYAICTTLIFLLFSEFVIPFDIVWVQLMISAGVIGYVLYCGLSTRINNYFFIALFAIGSIVFFYSADFVLNNVMEPHQRVRINVLLGLDEDLSEPVITCIKVRLLSVLVDYKAKDFLMVHRQS